MGKEGRGESIKELNREEQEKSGEGGGEIEAVDVVTAGCRVIPTGTRQGIEELESRRSSKA